MLPNSSTNRCQATHPTQLNVTLDTTDGFTDAGERCGEQWQWGFFDLINTYNNTQTNGDLDPDGFAVARSNMGVLKPSGSQFQRPSYMYTQNGDTTAGFRRDDSVPDFNDFEGGPLPVPNGAVQIHLQTVYGRTCRRWSTIGRSKRCESSS